tara:strand:+ start:3015 stop:3449 length:435 start_codon:yes stop_codon:yes gene_type:complete
MSERKTVFDAVVTELEGLAGIGKVTRNQETFTACAGADLPALYVENSVVSRDYLAFPDASKDDTEALMEVEIRGRVFQINDAVEAPLDSLLDGVETALMSSTSINAVVAAIHPPTDAPDIEAADNFGEFSTTYAISYFYNHKNP